LLNSQTMPQQVDSIWRFDGTSFLPIPWPQVPRSAECLEIISALSCCDTVGAPLFLRGSMLEQLAPHPLADIDLLLVAPKRQRVDLSVLDRFDRMVDIYRVDPKKSSVLMTLVRTRSLQVTGQEFPSVAVRVSRELIVDHWLHYAPFGFEPLLFRSDRRFVARVKQLLRSVALLKLMDAGRYSRDLVHCAGWLSEYETELGKLGARMLVSLDIADDSVFDVGRLQAWLRAEFYSRIREWNPVD
jgi:hypothetical protein